jgi:hypothetical protein
MSYFSEIDQVLDDILTEVIENPSADQKDSAKNEIKGLILDSYRNGQKTPVKRRDIERHEAPHEAGEGEPPAAPRAGIRRRPYRAR